MIAGAILVAAGCSHGTVSQLPTAPTATVLPVTVKRLTITPTGGGSVLVGGTSEITTSGPLPSTGAPLGAFAEYTDGSGAYVEATWTSSDSNVLVVSGSSMRAMGRGTATLTATAKGLTATEVFTVEPGIPGTWSGTYVVDQCSAGSGSMQELICSAVPGRTPGLLPVGAAAPISFLVRESGTDLTATAAFGDIRGTLTGTDRGANYLTLRGDLRSGRTTITVTYWDARVRTDVMDGFIGFEVRMDGVPSFAQVTGHFVDVTRR